MIISGNILEESKQCGNVNCWKADRCKR